MTQPEETPAGWYPVDGSQRYWDGQQWTDHVAPEKGKPRWVVPVVACVALAVVALVVGAFLGGEEDETATEATTTSATTEAPTTQAPTTEATTTTTTTATTTTTTTEAPTTESPTDRADAYALEKSGGVTTGCSSAAPGAEAEADPGCIYSVAFSGCLEGITGEEVGGPVEEQFPTEPALVALHDQAVSDCA